MDLNAEPFIIIVNKHIYKDGGGGILPVDFNKLHVICWKSKLRDVSFTTYGHVTAIFIH